MTAYLYNGNLHIWKDSLNIEIGRCLHLVQAVCSPLTSWMAEKINGAQ